MKRKMEMRRTKRTCKVKGRRSGRRIGRRRIIKRKRRRM